MKMRFSGRLALLTVVLGLVCQTPAYTQTFTVLYNFGTNSGGPLDPGIEVVAQGRDGNLYGTTPQGGTQGYGTVFKITPHTAKLTVLYNFDGPHGQAPSGGLTLGTDGNFYGTTWNGGTSGVGNIFKITPSGNLTVLYSFTGGSDGGNPYAPPVEGTDGNFYGTTWYDQMQGCGTVYKITPSGTFATLHAFGGTDGCMPIAPLIEVDDGSFYGTTELGANNNFGEVFRVTPSGQFAVIAQFHGTDGGNPYAPVVQGGDGDFYGTASGWGNSSWGTVYKATAKGVLTALYDFNGKSDGGGPYAGLVQATDGNFYGAASGGSFNNGTIYRINIQGAFSVVHNFDGTNGANPYTTLVRHTNGFLYGETVSGGTGSECGTHGCGTFYSLNVGLKPFVGLVSVSGKVGKTIEILGQGFTGTTRVAFNGTPATFTVVSSTYLTAVVPKGATTGFVTVTTPKGKLTSNKKFRVN